MPNRKDITGARMTTRTVSLAATAVAAFGLFWPVAIVTSTVAEAKTPGKTYCFLRKCHRVRTLAETQGLVGKQMTLRTSHYDDPRRDRFNPSNRTSSGERFRAGAADNAASPNLPNGTIVLAYNPATRKSAVLRINNAGPYWGNRTLDVSRGAAQKLGFASRGVSSLVVQVIRAPTREEATYRKGRRYAAVPGYIGVHASASEAMAEAQRRLGGGQALATPASTTRPTTTTVAATAGATATPPAAAAPIVASATPETSAAPTSAVQSPAPVASTPPTTTTATPVGARAPAKRQRTARTSSNTRRSSTGQTGYFKVDCKSMPDLCNSPSGRSTTGSRTSAIRTSDGSSSNKP